MNEYASLIVAVLTGLATAIPLVIKLTEYVQKTIKEKNWAQLLKLVQSLMEVAEQKFSDGAEKKEWVLMSLKATADQINYEIDYTQVGNMIDELIDMTRNINSVREEKKEGEKNE